MINLSAIQVQLLADNDAERFYCVRIKDLFMTDYSRDLVTFEGTYLSSNMLVGVTPPEATSSVDRSLYEVVLSDPGNALGDQYTQGLIGSKLTVQLGFVDPSTEEPLVSDMFMLYSGIVQGKDVNFETDIEGETITKITGSNVLAALDATDGFYSSRETLRNIDPSDSAFDQVYEGSRSLTLLWGKR